MAKATAPTLPLPKLYCASSKAFPVQEPNPSNCGSPKLVTNGCTRQIAESVEATGMAENETAARSGGRIAKKARLDLESKTGKPVITGANFLPPPRGLLEKKK